MPRDVASEVFRFAYCFPDTQAPAWVPTFAKLRFASCGAVTSGNSVPKPERGYDEKEKP